MFDPEDFVAEKTSQGGNGDFFSKRKAIENVGAVFFLVAHQMPKEPDDNVGIKKRKEQNGPLGCWFGGEADFFCRPIPFFEFFEQDGAGA